MDRFLARTVRYQARMLDAVEAHGLVRVDTGGRTVTEVADAVLAAAAAARTRPGR